MSTYQDYNIFLSKKISNLFDFEENIEINGIFFNKKCSYHEKNTKYAFSKDIKIFEVETNELLLFNFEKIEYKNSLINETKAIKSALPEIVAPHSDHMSTQILIIHVINDDISPEIETYARRFSYQKGFAFGLKGWADLGLVVISLGTNRVVTHRKFMKTASFLIPEKAV